MSNKIRIVLIEDHDLSRIGLIAALQQEEMIEVVGQAATGGQGLKVIKSTKPDVAIVDIGLPDQDGIELTQSFKKSESDLTTKILILTMHNNEDAVLAAFAAGADSYALKDISIENLVQAIQVTSEGNSWIDPAIARIVLKQTKQIQPQDKRMIESIEPEYQKILESAPLTERELEVLELIVSGCNNAQIADKLYITIGTVKTHVRSILNKLSANDRTQAAVRALRSGLVE